MRRLLLVVLLMTPASAGVHLGPGGGLGDYVYENVSAVPAPPFTVSCWFNRNNLLGSQVLLCFSDSTVANQEYILYTGQSPKTLFWLAYSGTLTQVQVDAWTQGEWSHAAAVEASASSRWVYIDGVASAEGTVTKSPTGLNATAFGIDLDTSPAANAIKTKIAHVAIWNVALTPEEVSSLAAGAHPMAIRPWALTHYWPCDDAFPATLVRDTIGACSLTLSAGSPIQSESHPVRPPTVDYGFWGRQFSDPIRCREEDYYAVAT